MLYNEELKEYYSLTDKQLEEMYEKVTKLIFDKQQKKHEHPIAILTGGQPGAGKSGIVLNAKQQLSKINRNPIILDGDLYRGMYPKAIEIAKKVPELYSEITDKAVGKIMGKLIENTIENGYDFIREGTLNSAEIVDQLLNSEKNYKITIRLIAVCKEESLLCVFERYIAMKEILGIGRLTTINSHNKRYNQFPKTARIQANKGVEIEVYERTKNITNPKIIYKTTSKENTYSCFEEALIAGREKSYVEFQKTAKKRLENINKSINKLDRKDEAILEELNQLNKIISAEIKYENEIYL